MLKKYNIVISVLFENIFNVLHLHFAHNMVKSIVQQYQNVLEEFLLFERAVTTFPTLFNFCGI